MTPGSGAEYSLLSSSQVTGKVSVSTSEQEREQGGREGVGYGDLAPVFILTLNVNSDKLPPLPAPTGPPLTPRQGFLAGSQGSLSLPVQRSQGTGSPGKPEPCRFQSRGLKDPAEAPLVQVGEDSPH